MTYHLLLIDDDTELAELLSEYLATEGFELTCCHDGLSGLKQAQQQAYDLILLDIMMPGLSGIEVLKALGDNHQTPILMLTAKGDDADKILGLELGADDYLAKPYNLRELLARIKAIIRRVEMLRAPTDDKIIRSNQVELNHTTRTATCNGKVLSLTGTEYQLLTELMENCDQIISKEQLSQLVLGRRLSPFDRSIDMHVSNVRKKIQAHCQDDVIKTIRNAGYVFLSGSQQQ